MLNMAFDTEIKDIYLFNKSFPICSSMLGQVREQNLYCCTRLLEETIWFMYTRFSSYKFTLLDLFSQIYTRISSKVVGILLRARKYGFVDFEPEILFQVRTYLQSV